MNICKKKKECEILTLHNKDIEIEEKNKLFRKKVLSKTNKLFRKKFYQKENIR